LYPENKLLRFREEMKENVLADLREGKLSYMGVATKNGTTIGTVFSIAKKNGLRKKDLKAAGTGTEKVNGQ
jgi:hypothetical protein